MIIIDLLNFLQFKFKCLRISVEKKGLQQINYESSQQLKGVNLNNLIISYKQANRTREK